MGLKTWAVKEEFHVVQSFIAVARKHQDKFRRGEKGGKERKIRLVPGSLKVVENGNEY